jgi:hypothetical protein
VFWQWLSGAGKRCDIDGDLIELLDVERDAAASCRWGGAHDVGRERQDAMV